MTRTPPSPQALGFTLVELLVALALMALLATMSWRVIDSMTRTQTHTQAHADHWLAWQTAMAQWQTDLDALQDPQGDTPPLDFDGRVLRLVRREAASPADPTPALRVVAWTLQTDGATGHTHWTRWRSAALRQRADLVDAWQQAGIWSRTGVVAASASQVRLPAVSGWQLYYHRGGAWSNPQSSSGTSAPDTRPEPLPDGIRLVLTLPGAGPLGGTLTKDWARPQLGGGKAE